VQPDAVWIDSSAHSARTLVEHLERYIITEDVRITDRTREFAQIRLVGPDAPRLVALLAEKEPQVIAAINDPAELMAGNLRVRRNDSTGAPGFDLLCGADDAPKIWRALVDQGAQPAGLDVYHILRLESGTPEYGLDIDDSNLPQEVDRDARAISFTKGCYLGQETICRIRDLGHANRKLAGLRIEGTNAPAPGSRVLRDSQEIGRVTSSAVSPRLGVLALAYLRRGHHDAGIEVEVEMASQRLPARISALPFA
jgi:folate-binding protein YgfZ